MQIRIPADQMAAAQPEKTMHVDGVGTGAVETAASGRRTAAVADARA
ncbi:hypothetical protein [Streptomyces sp. IBSBF 2806]